MSNTKDIKDYLHLYVGCECMVTWKLFMNRTDGRYPLDGWMLLMSHNAIQSIKPFLRPLNDMTKEEDVYIKRILRDNHGIDTIKTVLKNGWHLGHIGANASQMFQITQYLLSKGFDLFGLIEAGLAIDSTKQPKP